MALQEPRTTRTEAAATLGAPDTLRILTCGSVDDGKSTLIGRLLYDSKLLLADQIADLEQDSRKHGTAGEEIDFALLVDGLEAEREQGITIDVAWRFFATPRRRFIVADTPGHEQYTRNMATGASTAELAILLVDASKGLTRQTRRHALICSLLGIRQAVLAVNKMDLVDFDEAVFRRISEDFQAFAEKLRITSITPIPLSAREGDNVTAPSPNMPWWDGPALVPFLEEAPSAPGTDAAPMRFPVQWVCRPDRNFRGYAGTLASGRLRPGDEVVVAASGRRTRVAAIDLGSEALEEALAGQSVMVRLEDEVDIARGDMLVAPEARPEVTDQIAAHLVWMGEEPLLPGRPYWLKAAGRTVSAQVSELKHHLSVDTLEETAGKVLELNEIGFANLSLAAPIAFDPYAENRETGSFVLIDRFTHATVAAGMVDFSLRRAANIHWQSLDIDREARARLKNQKPTILWFTGLSGAGKSTVANWVEKKLYAAGRHTVTLDGDNVRHGLNRDLGFTDADRVENIRRVAETAKLMTDAGLIVLVSFISPFRSEREMARSLVADGEFVEVFVDTPLKVAEMRDPKGLYAKARAGKLKNFTGIDSPYEPPEAAEIVLDTTAAGPEELADRIIDWLAAKGRLD